ncbi:hypothetical protein [Paenibacillus harenae]|uniref:hypothetical protein n=1 Tax=Paenibacillus harenae TaxID=306543 RepID=UPI002791D338|nr:hypothetical protein [Paenibacillus harenae]MDQ0064043.1 hypothetical protein [Paenibacillus harenae]
MKKKSKRQKHYMRLQGKIIDSSIDELKFLDSRPAAISKPSLLKLLDPLTPKTPK